MLFFPERSCYFGLMSEVDTGRHADTAVCPSFVAAMQVLGKRWNGHIIQVIGTGRLRYSELKQQVVGISDAVLAARLAELTGCGLVTRDAGTTGRGGDYGLTARGLELADVLAELTLWAERWEIGDCPGNHPANCT